MNEINQQKICLTRDSMKTEKPTKTVNLKTDGHKTTTNNQIFTMNRRFLSETEKYDGKIRFLILSNPLFPNTNQNKK